MSIRIRKLIGTFALFALVIVWALIAMAIAQFPPIFNNPWIAAVYYVVAGIGWILPARPPWRGATDVSLSALVGSRRLRARASGGSFATPSRRR